MTFEPVSQTGEEIRATMAFPSARSIFQTYLFQFYSQAFLLACQENIFPTLSQLKETDAETLAYQLQLHVGMLADLLDVLALAGLLKKSIKEGKTVYQLSASADFYLGQLSPYATMNGFAQFHASTWSLIIAQGSQVLRTGVAASRGSPESAERWNDVVKAIGSLSLSVFDLVASFIDDLCRNTEREIEVLDAGCGAGLLSSQLMQHNERIVTTGADFPSVLHITQETMAHVGVATRFFPLPGNMLQQDLQGPRGPYNICFASLVCQVLDLEKIEQLFRQVYAATKPGGLFLIIELLPDEERAGPEMEILFSFMMSYIGGRAYTEGTYRQLLEKTGWGGCQVVRTDGVPTLIVARKGI